MAKKSEVEKLLKEILTYRGDIKHKEIKDFLEEAEKEKKELEESYQESIRQREERKAKEWVKGYNKWKKDHDGKN